MAKIFYLMGKSSSGKDTIYNRIINDENPGLKTIVGYTTRPMRHGETNGKEYFFVSPLEMNDLDNAGKVIEKRTYNTVHGPWSYFTVDDEQVDLERYDYLLIGTLESYEKVRDYYGKDVVMPIFIEVDDGERLMRALKREMSQESPKYAELCRRFLADAEDFSEEKIKRLEINRRFVNDDMDRCIKEIKEFIGENIY
ncbi:MAG: guanylate kinase [Lachnospiraceae bacterium]|nr:guanylate kinase [Lachnospiraceae bacterium]